MRTLLLRKLEQLVQEAAQPADRDDLLGLVQEMREAHELDMLPPEWDSIDSRFQWRGSDNKGSWYVMTDKPLENSVGYQRLTGEMLFLRPPGSHRWKETLQQRPRRPNHE